MILARILPSPGPGPALKGRVAAVQSPPSLPDLLFSFTQSDTITQHKAASIQRDSPRYSFLHSSLFLLVWFFFRMNNSLCVNSDPKKVGPPSCSQATPPSSCSSNPFAGFANPAFFYSFSTSSFSTSSSPPHFSCAFG